LRDYTAETDRGRDAYVFGTEIGTRVRCFARAWRTAVLKAHGERLTVTKTRDFSDENKAALERIDLHFHDLRREAGSRWLEGGVPLHTIQRWLGHTNISQTSTYLAVTDAGSHEAMSKFDEGRGLLPSAGDPEPEADDADAADDAGAEWQKSGKGEGGKWSGRPPRPWLGVAPLDKNWSGRLDSNQRHLAPKASALPG
jgi:hypothetical protein